jgi:uncharacterized protein with ParB-like and HNH nuclease domain
MTENKIELKSISELLGMNFFIPSYQRGYRWTEQQVKDLLDDIWEFIESDPKKDELYCLQPIVVKICNDKTIEKYKLESSFDENKWYEVIDGQQRLTTIFLIIHYFNEMWEGKDKIKELQIRYEIRNNSTTFLQKLEICGQIDKVAISGETIDYYHITNAYNTIHGWVKQKQTSKDGFKKDNFKSTFQYSTQVIWYDISETDSNPIDTFIRINMGKIPLTNAELIKALFLQEKNFGKESANLRKVSIAKEWDIMEYALQDEDLWWFLNKKQNDIPARIEFLFDLICAVEKEKDNDLINKIGTDEHAIFRFFYNKFSNKITVDDVEKQWNEIKNYFLSFEDWYNHPIWYHYIGFLIFAGKSVAYIYNLYKGVTKDNFTENLKKEVKKTLNVSCEKIKGERKESDENKNVDSIIAKANEFLSSKNTETTEQYTYEFDLKFKNTDKNKIKQLLLLCNLQYIVKQHENQEKKNGSVFIKFPFKLFKSENWDVEHIDSYTTNLITDKNTAVEWLKAAAIDLGNKFPDSLKQEIISFIDGKDNFSSFSKLNKDIIEIADESSNDENDDDTKNSLGNLTLLDAGTNRSYGNALFPTKRRIIIERDKDGIFIPVCTKNVFLKYFDEQGSAFAKWNENDIINYQNNIGSILEEFLTIKSNSNE